MKSDTVSIIIPIYNEEKLLLRCVQSVISQTHRNLEIILVDDGSTDSSPEICDHFAKQDSRIRVIHQDNQGLSAARNAGLDIATSDYIQFVDSDDWILPTMTEELMTALVEDSSDTAQCRFYTISNSYEYEMLLEEISINNNSDINNVHTRKIYSGEDLYHLLNSDNLCTVVQWNKLFKKEIFEKLRFPVGKLHEDEFVIHHELAKMKSLSHLDRKLYVYMQNPKSITHQNSLKNQMHICEAFLDRVRFFVEHGIYSEATVPYALLLRKIASFEKNAMSQSVPGVDGKEFQDWLRQIQEKIKTIPNEVFP